MIAWIRAFWRRHIVGDEPLSHGIMDHSLAMEGLRAATEAMIGVDENMAGMSQQAILARQWQAGAAQSQNPLGARYPSWNNPHVALFPQGRCPHCGRPY